jgi:spermidine/putrescine transport system permease protein
LRQTLINLLYSLPSIVYLSVFFYVPIMFVFILSFYEGGPFFKMFPRFTLENYVNFLTSEVGLRIFLTSHLISLSTFLIVTLMSFPIAYFLARMMDENKSLLIMLLMFIPLEMNYLLRVFAWRNIVGESGLINNTLLYLGLIDRPIEALFHSIYAIILVGTHNSLPYAVFPLYIVLRNIPKNLYYAAMDLGSNKVGVFFRITLPLSMPAIAISFLFNYLALLSEFAIPSLVGGTTYMLGNHIEYNFLVVGNWPYASAVTVTLLLTTIIISLLIFKLFNVRSLYE